MHTPEMRRMYRKCKQVAGGALEASCNVCASRASLAHCLDCGVTLCESGGHLAAHMQRNRNHRWLFSYKLRRQVKCAKADCPATDVYELRACHSCLSDAFDKHYNMCKALWSAAGLKRVVNAIRCDEHFNWHRVNCSSAGGEDGTLFGKSGSQESSHICDFLF